MKRLSKKRLALLTLCVCSAIANSGFAAETEDIDVYGGDEFVVTATRTKLEAKEVPVAAEVITEQKIKDLGAYSVQDALRLAANVDVQDNGMTGNQVMLRGNSSIHTLILIDGKRMAAENSNTTMNAYELKRVNIADVERIEIIRGNSSALYGADALGGVVNIITKKATKPYTSIDVHTGTKDAATSFSYGSGKQGKFSMKVSGAIEKMREIDTDYNFVSSKKGYQGPASSSNMFGTRRILNTGFQWDFDDNHGLEFDMNFMREQMQSHSNGYAMVVPPGVPPMAAMMGGVYYYVPSSSNHYYDNNRSDYALTYFGKDGKHDYNFRTYYNTLKKYSRSSNAGAVVDFDDNTYKTFVIEAKDTYAMDDNNTLTYGLEYNKATMNGTHLLDSGSDVTYKFRDGITKPASEESAETYSAYLQDEIKLGDKLRLFPAVRVDHHDVYGTHTSPKIGATYNLSNNARIKANWGKGFRAPTLYELYATMEKSGMMPGFTVRVLGNKDLEPEKSTNFDIGFEAEKGKASGKVTYYHNDIKNLISYDDYNYPLMAMGIMETQYINVAEAEIEGVEAEFGYNFDEHWSASATYNFVDAVDKSDGSRLLFRAKQSGVVKLNFTDAKENPLTFTLYNRWYVDYQNGSDMGGMISKRQDYSYGVTGVVVNKQINKNLRIYGGVDNIFDKQFYYDGDANIYAIDGRTWRLGAEMTF